MDWLADILKNLAVSRPLVAAVFVTSAVMHVGPLLAPNEVPKVQADLVPYVFAAMVLTGCLLLFWGLAGVWSIARSSVRGTARVFSSSSLSQPETAILFFMAKNPTEPIDLDHIDYSRAPGTKLEFLHWTQLLQQKGLARINEWNDNLVSLTDLGRRRALEIQRQAKRESAA